MFTPKLTPRELDMLQYTAQGLTDIEIAHACFISERTVRRHFDNIRAKLNANNRASTVAQGFRLGFLK